LISDAVSHRHRPSVYHRRGTDRTVAPRSGPPARSGGGPRTRRDRQRRSTLLTSTPSSPGSLRRGRSPSSATTWRSSCAARSAPSDAQLKASHRRIRIAVAASGTIRRIVWVSCPFKSSSVHVVDGTSTGPITCRMCPCHGSGGVSLLARCTTGRRRWSLSNALVDACQRDGALQSWSETDTSRRRAAVVWRATRKVLGGDALARGPFLRSLGRVGTADSRQHPRRGTR
jgi:hypothetical protein